MPATILGDIIERKPTAQPTKSNNLSHKADASTGFPKATHRSQSVFAKARANKNQAVPNVAPTIKPGDRSGDQDVKSSPVTHVRTSESQASSKPAPKNGEGDADWRTNMEKENEQLVETMSESERFKEREDLIAQFGPDLVNLINKMGERKKNPLEATSLPPRKYYSCVKYPVSLSMIGPKSAMAHSRSSTAESTASNKSLRRIRFSEEPAKVYRYESEPPSPKRVIALLPPPTPEDSDAVQVKPPNVWKFNPTPENPPIIQEKFSSDPVDESTPESLREKYFPNEPPPSQNPTLAWLMPTKETTTTFPSAGSNSEDIRYDLQGRPIPAHLTKQLPVYLGLHHHGESPGDAGYTLDELLLLSHSTLPAQRAAMLQVLARIVSRLRKGSVDEREKNIVSDTLKKCFIVAIEGFSDRSSAPVRAAGLEILWQGFASEPPRPGRAGAVELTSHSLEDLPMDNLLEGLQFCITRTAPSSTFLVQTLEFLKIICSLSSKFTEEITTAPNLLEEFIRCINSLRTSGVESGLLIGQALVALLELLKSIVITSRKCAQALIPDISDSFLRNIAEIFNSTSQQQIEPTSISVISHILDFYALLGRYGLGTAIASSAHELLQRLGKVVTQNMDLTESYPLVRSWLSLLEVWIACAINPHHTTPPHDILWSRVIAWNWSEALLRLRDRMITESIKNDVIWSQWWRTWTMWLQGCRLNEPDAGGKERKHWSELSSSSWSEDGLEREVFDGAISFLRKPNLSVNLGVNSQGSASVCLAGLLLMIEMGEDSGSYFTTASICSNLGEILQTLLDKSVWEVLRGTYQANDLRIWTNLLALILRFIRTKSSNLHPSVLSWHYQVLAYLWRGDEIQASEIVAHILATTLTEENYKNLSFQEEIWTRSGGPTKILLPLYRYALWPREDYFVGPIIPYPPALAMTTTLSADNNRAVMKTPSGGILGITLPLTNESDWLSAPLDILLRSGSTHSRLFKTLPNDWSASESDVVISLFLLLLKRKVTMSRNQIIFTCMKVFMLEHDQETSKEGEVFRNSSVDKLMTALLEPLKLSQVIHQTINTSSDLLSEECPPLEEIASAFLGSDQPFYQFYSDLVGLYDSISFGNKPFGALLLPPTSQRYSKDYRKLLWGDHLPMLRSIQVEAGDIYCNMQESKSWLWPIEALQDTEMLSIYVKALLKGHLSGFLKFVAIHQATYCMWPDLLEARDERRKSQATNLLKAFLTTSDEELLRDVLHYQQDDRNQAAIIPPYCYTAPSKVITSRIDWAVGVCGESVRNRLPSM
jgi:RNA polymerase II-associated protein 1